METSKRVSLSLRKFSNKQIIIVVFAFAQILFGLVTIFCNQDIFDNILDQVRHVNIISVTKPNILATSCSRGNQNISSLAEVSSASLHQVLLLQHAQW